MATDKQPENAQANVWRAHMLAVATNQDAHAYRAIYLHFAPKVKSFYFNHGMQRQAEELTHEAFLKIWQKAASYNPQKASVSTWIFTIVRNLRIDVLRRKRITEVSDDDQVEISEQDGVETDLQTIRDADKIGSLFELLNPEQRNVMQKVYFEDKSHQHTADELELTPGVVKSRIRSSLRILRAHMGGEQS